MIGEPASPSDPFGLVGGVIDRKYRVDRLVAEGGFGVVYAGWHLGLDSPVAIKVLKRTSGIAPDAWTDRLLQFLDEAKTLAKLRHPNIVTVLDAGISPLDGLDGDEDAGQPWMVLEWLEGGTLRDDLERRRAMGSTGRAPAECLAILRPVLEAMADAHEAGVVHRDLKPSNIMLTPRWGGVTARVLDFGIAKMLVGGEWRGEASGNTATGTRVTAFTLASAAPEQLSGSRTGPWTDVYALALLLTEMLADRPPYSPHDAHEHYQLVFHAERPTPRSLAIDVGAWEAVLARALSVRPAERHADARALWADLERALPHATSMRAPAGSDTAPAVAQSHATALRPHASWLGWAVAGGGAALLLAGLASRGGSSAPREVAAAAPVAIDAGVAIVMSAADAAPARVETAVAPMPSAMPLRRRLLRAPIVPSAPSTEAHAAPPIAPSASSRDSPGIIERSPY